MAHLTALPDLQYLELRDNNLGDVALEHLKRLNKSDYSICEAATG